VGLYILGCIQESLILKYVPGKKIYPGKFGRGFTVFASVTDGILKQFSVHCEKKWALLNKNFCRF
jgi:hypothetical protein